MSWICMIFNKDNMNRWYDIDLFSGMIIVTLANLQSRFSSDLIFNLNLTWRSKNG